MRRSRPLLVTATAAVIALGGLAGAQAQVISSTDDGTAPLTAAEFPQMQAQNILDALSNTDPVSPGTPNGYHNGYAGLGFDDPDFDGSARRVFVLDCSTLTNGCDSGSAPASRIN